MREMLLRILSRAREKLLLPYGAVHLLHMAYLE
jgi:hypothetical protein